MVEQKVTHWKKQEKNNIKSMTYQLIILDLATDDAKNAFEYYEDQQTGLGFRFETALVNTFEYIHKHPLHFKIEKRISVRH